MARVQNLFSDYVSQGSRTSAQAIDVRVGKKRKCVLVTKKQQALTTVPSQRCDETNSKLDTTGFARKITIKIQAFAHPQSANAEFGKTQFFQTPLISNISMCGPLEKEKGYLGGHIDCYTKIESSTDEIRYPKQCLERLTL